ncbi:MAG: NUDIX domain-containing protein [Nakamurella sp.]
MTPDPPPSTPIRHEVLAAVFSVRADDQGFASLHVLIWQRAQAPDAGRWALPGGGLGPDEDVEGSMRRHLADKVDLAEVAHLEQLATFSAPGRVPGERVVATGFVGLVPWGVSPSLPPDTAWRSLDHLPATALDHGRIIDRAHERLRGKLSYTNIAFALAQEAFTIAALSRIYYAVLGHHVDPTNLQRILGRRGMLERTGGTTSPGRAGGRPAAQFTFTTRELRVTDPFAAFRPPDR